MQGKTFKSAYKKLFMKSMYGYIRDAWKQGTNIRDRLIKWRKSDSVVRVEKPTRLDRARSLGYKAKQGYVVVRVKLKRGGRKRERFKGGRRSKHMRRRKVVKKSYQWVSEERANRKYPNCEVLGSYPLAKDGKHYFFEVLLADRVQVGKYDSMGWLGDAKGRVFRGLTSAAIKSRGLRKKGIGTEKIRPSLRANKRLGK